MEHNSSTIILRDGLFFVRESFDVPLGSQAQLITELAQKGAKFIPAPFPPLQRWCKSTFFGIGAKDQTIAVAELAKVPFPGAVLAPRPIAAIQDRVDLNYVLPSSTEINDFYVQLDKAPCDRDDDFDPGEQYGYMYLPSHRKQDIGDDFVKEPDGTLYWSHSELRFFIILQESLDHRGVLKPPQFFCIKGYEEAYVPNLPNVYGDTGAVCMGTNMSRIDDPSSPGSGILGRIRGALHHINTAPVNDDLRQAKLHEYTTIRWKADGTPIETENPERGLNTCSDEAIMTFVEWIKKNEL